MKTTSTLKSIFTAIAATCLFCLTVLTAPADAALLQVDMQITGATTQSGDWQAWDAASSPGTNSLSKSFSYGPTTGGDLDVTYSSGANFFSRDQGLDQVTDSGDLTYPDVWADLIASSPGSTGHVQLEFSNLKAGDYTFSSYHYADDYSDNLGHNGIANVLVDGTDTGDDQEFLVGWENEASSTPNNYTANTLQTDGIFTTDFTVASDGDAVTIKYALYDNATFGLNGFEIIAIPEPASFILLLLGGFGLLFRRPRQR